jgi:hypothetical protein
MGIEPVAVQHINHLTGAGGANRSELESYGDVIGLCGLWHQALWVADFMLAWLTAAFACTGI